MERLKKLFYECPPDLAECRRLLENGHFSEENLAELALFIVGACEEDDDYPERSVFHKDYVLDELELLFEFGLTPSSIYDEQNFMWSAQWIKQQGVGASIMRLCLEHGGTPDMLCPDKHNLESLIDYIGFKVFEDCDDREYFYEFQCWLVLIGYGVDSDDGIEKIMLNGNHPSIFKEFEKFDYAVERSPRPNDSTYWIMHIFNKETGEEVAVVE